MLSHWLWVVGWYWLLRIAPEGQGQAGDGVSLNVEVAYHWGMFGGDVGAQCTCEHMGEAESTGGWTSEGYGDQTTAARRGGPTTSGAQA